LAVGAGLAMQVWPMLQLFPGPAQSEFVEQAVFDLWQTSPQSADDEHAVPSPEHVPSPSGGGGDSSAQVAEHPSPSTTLPSSHSSPSSTWPFPHTGSGGGGPVPSQVCRPDLHLFPGPSQSELPAQVTSVDLLQTSGQSDWTSHAAGVREQVPPRADGVPIAARSSRSAIRASPIVSNESDRGA